MNSWGKQCCCRSALALFWRPCLRRRAREIERGSCWYTAPPHRRSSVKLVQEPFLYLQILSFTHFDSVTSVLKIRIISAVATQSKIKHRLTDAQTYVGLPSTSVTVRCFFMSACFTVMSLSSGLTSSRLQRNAKLFFLFLFFFLSQRKQCSCRDPDGLLDFLQIHFSAAAALGFTAITAPPSD